MIRPLLLFAALSFSSLASAQTPTAFVAIHGLTVEGRDPPDYLRATLDSSTTGVMRDFDVCYAGRQATRANLAGTIGLRLWVSAQQVIRVTPESNTVGDDDLLACVKSRLLALRLPSDSPRAGATVRFTIQFTAPAAGNLVQCVDRVCRSVPCGASGAPCCPVDECSGSGLVCTNAVCAVPPPPPPLPPPPTYTATVTRVTGALAPEAVTALLPASALEACVTPDVTRAGNYVLTFSRTGRVTVGVSRAIRPAVASTCVRNALRTITPGVQPRSTSVRLTVARAVVAAP